LADTLAGVMVANLVVVPILFEVKRQAAPVVTFALLFLLVLNLAVMVYRQHLVKALFGKLLDRRKV